MTKKEMFAMIAEINADNTEIVDFCNREIELLDKRKGSKSLSKTQRENEVIMVNMLDALTDIGTPCTVSELLKHGVEGFELSNQKASALLRKLIEVGKVEKVMDGKKALFSLT